MMHMPQDCDKIFALSPTCCEWDPVQAVKEQIQKEKDLEGIDLSNIVSGGRRSRAAAVAPRVSYRCPAPHSPVQL